MAGSKKGKRRPGGGTDARPARVTRTKPRPKRRTRVGPRAQQTDARARRRVAAIDARLKTLTVAAEPPPDANPSDLDAAFRTDLLAVLSDLETAHTPFKLIEGFRTVERQQWLYGSGRPQARYGRPGPILTNADGVKKKSAHQGDGTPGTGRAADCYPLRDGAVYIPPASDPVWKVYADVVQARGLIAGYYWPTKDSPHCEKAAG